MNKEVRSSHSVGRAVWKMSDSRVMPRNSRGMPGHVVFSVERGAPSWWEVDLRVDDIRQVVVVAEYTVKGFGERIEYFGHLLHTKVRRTTAK